MTSPFDDPDFREQMARMGVAHETGMAADLMQQMAPLLAADGVDINNLGADVDLDDINEAMGRAVAQHNFMLATPVGAQRDQALSALRDVALALASENAGRAASILGSIEPEPRDGGPSVAHVIGVALGLLDTWHSDAAARNHLARTRVPQWRNARSRKAGTDIVGLAKKGRAFDSDTGLHRQHTGFYVFEGAALAVAGSVIAWAASEGVEVETLVDREVTEQGFRASTPQGAAFRRPKAPEKTTSTGDLQRGFRAWLENEAPDIGAPTVDEELQLFEGLLRMAAALSLDITTPAGATTLFDEFFESADDFPLQEALLTLYDYVQFQLELADDPSSDWEVLCISIEDELDGDSGVVEAVKAAVEGDVDIPDADRRGVLEQMLIVTAVGPLLEWVGNGRPVTATGNVRRADISAVAALLEIDAVDVATRPLPDDEFARSMGGDEPKQFKAKSMSDVPMLSEWWEALRICDVLSVTGSRVKPGPAASAWIDGSAELEGLQMLVSVFVSELITGSNLQQRLGIARAASLLQEFGALLDPGVPVDRDDDERHDLMRALTFGTITRLPSLGIGEVDADGAVSLPHAARGTVARGVLIAMSILRGSLE